MIRTTLALASAALLLSACGPWLPYRHIGAPLPTKQGPMGHAHLTTSVQTAR